MDDSNGVFAVSLPSHGELAWAQAFGSEANEAAGWVALDRAGSVLLVGFFERTTLHDLTEGRAPDRALISEIGPDESFRFRPHFGWAGHIELQPRAVAQMGAAR